MYNDVIAFIKGLYGGAQTVPLHEPRFAGNEKRYVNECIDSTFVSSVGKFVDRFEMDLAEYTGSGYAVATVNGTAALHTALLLAGVDAGSEVVTQPLTFVATCNAISYCGARPVFVDVDSDTMGLSPASLAEFLSANARLEGGKCVNKRTGRTIKACVPMHTFGHPCRVDEIMDVCGRYGIALIEDAAESVGSFYKGRHTGTFGVMGIVSFNGNKIVTAGGGGALITADEGLAKKAKHLTTTARIAHRWEFSHDTVGYNYRMPNLNAALLCAQIEKIESFVENKRLLAGRYLDFFKRRGSPGFAVEPEGARSNYWLNAVRFGSPAERDGFLKATNEAGVMTRPVWRLMNDLPMFGDCLCAGIPNARELYGKVVNIPSSVIS